MEVVLHDEEDILGGGEAAVLMLPLLPAFRAQLGEVVHQALHPVDGEYIFALADNYLQLEIVRSEFPHLHIVSLCQPEDQGYNHKAFCTADPQEKRAAIVRLIVSADLLLHAKKFVGSITTGPSVFILKQRHAEPTVIAADCAKEALASVLTLPIDQRAALSAYSL